MMSNMDITIGLVDTPRELSIESAVGGEDLKATIKQKLASGDGILELVDGSGKEYFVQVSKVAYVRVGATSPRKVGFIA